MNKLKIYEDSKNYTAQIVRLRQTQPLAGLDKLVGVNIFGNLVLLGKDYELDQLYLFVPSGTVLSDDFLSSNNLYREPTLNEDKSAKGYFEPSGRVKAVKFKGHVSSGIILRLESLSKFGINVTELVEGQEFNEIDGIHVCRKWVLPIKGSANQAKKNKVIDNLVDSLIFKEHYDTEHLLKNLHKLELNDYIVITTKLHGTSERVGLAPVKKSLSWLERFLKWAGVSIKDEVWDYVVGSRRVIKSIGFTGLKGKKHFIEADEKGVDLWTRVAQENFEGRLYHGERIYFEVVGKDYNGKSIQPDYHYGLSRPKVYIYRISWVNEKGYEFDLSWRQTKARCAELGISHVPEIFSGRTILDYFYKILYEEYPKNIDITLQDKWPNFASEWRECLSEHLKQKYLDKPSVMDSNITEEGVCLRVESYPKPHVYKLKSPLFLLHESGQQDKEVADVEEQN